MGYVSSLEGSRWPPYERTLGHLSVSPTYIPGSRRNSLSYGELMVNSKESPALNEIYIYICPNVQWGWIIYLHLGNFGGKCIGKKNIH